MLPGIGDFLKSTLGESLTKPLQPAALFAAAILVLLNALFTYPALIDQGHPVAVALRDVGATAQFVLAAVLVLALAYVLLSLGGSILKLMTGELWGRSPIVGATLRQYQQGQYMNLKQQVWASSDKTPQARVKRQQLLFRVVTDFPANQDLIVPTALGNVIQATIGYLWDHYRIDMAALWPHMETVVASKDALSKRIDNEKATLDFLLNLALVLDIFAFEHLAVRFALRQWPESVWSLAFVAVGWGVYRAAVGKARSWTSAVQQAFDLYRDELRQALRVRPFRDFEDELDAWQRISRWLLWGESPGDLLAFGSEDSVASSAPPAPLQFATSANVSASVQAQNVVDDNTPAAGAARQVEWRQAIEYVFFVTATTALDKAQATPPRPAEGVYLITTDSRVPRLTPGDVTAARKWSAEIVPTGAQQPANAVLWTRPSLPANAASALRYSLPVARVRARTEHDALQITAPLNIAQRDGAIALDYTLRIDNVGGTIIQADTPVRVFDSRAPEVMVPCAARLTRWRDVDPTKHVSRLTADVWVDNGDSGWTWTIPREIWGDEHIVLRFQLRLLKQPQPSARLNGILSGLKICPGVPRRVAHDAPTIKDIIQTGSIDERCWTLMEFDGLTTAMPGPNQPDERAAARSNLGCLWMQLYCWDQADAALRSALISAVPNWTAAPHGAMSAKEAADWNLDLLHQARAAWGLGGTR